MKKEDKSDNNKNDATVVMFIFIVVIAGLLVWWFYPTKKTEVFNNFEVSNDCFKTIGWGMCQTEKQALVELQDKLDKVIETLPLKEQCRISPPEDKFYFSVVDYKNSQVYKCEPYLEKVPEHYKLP
jgi:hypothetical protein